MTEWSEARQLAAQYQSSGSTGSGFATFASTGNVTTDLWKNIHYAENASGPGTEEWYEDMQELRALLRAEGYALTAGSKVDSEGGHRADVAAVVLQAYYAENGGPENYGQDTYSDEGSDICRETLVDLLSDLRHLAFRSGLDFEACNDAASENYCAELEDWSE